MELLIKGHKIINLKNHGFLITANNLDELKNGDNDIKLESF